MNQCRNAVLIYNSKQLEIINEFCMYVAEEASGEQAAGFFYGYMMMKIRPNKTFKHLSDALGIPVRVIYQLNKRVREAGK